MNTELYIRRRLFCVCMALVFCSPFAASAALPGQVMVDPESPSWFVYNRDSDGNGKKDPVFICGAGDPEDFLYRGTRNTDGSRNGDQVDIIANMHTQGSNSIYFQAIRSHGGDGDSSHNPYINSDPSGQLDEDILGQWDGWLNAMDDAGIIMYFFFYDDSARIWSGDEVGSAENHLITTLVNRYEHLKHLVWVVAEEYTERYSPERISNIAELIRKTDDNNHPIANHQHSGISFDHAEDADIDQFAIQYNITSAAGLHSGMVQAWKNAAGRYANNMSESIDHGYGSRTEVRRKNWAIAMGGAYVMVIRMDGTSAYNTKMNDCKILSGFFESTNFNTMAPRDDLGNSGTWVLADVGQSYIAYRSSAGSFALSGMSAGKYTLSWLDTATGVKRQQERSLSAGVNSLSRPTAIGDEAVVWLRKTGEKHESHSILPILHLLQEK